MGYEDSIVIGKQYKSYCHETGSIITVTARAINGSTVECDDADGNEYNAHAIALHPAETDLIMDDEQLSEDADSKDNNLRMSLEQMQEAVNQLLGAGMPALAQNSAIMYFLNEDVNDSFFEHSEFDLNPHLPVLKLCEEISNKVKMFGLTCSAHEVMLVWLTNAATYGLYINKKP